MKKLIFLMMAIIAICVTSCHKDKNVTPVEPCSDVDSVLYSFANKMDSIDKNYRWFETEYELTTTVDSLDSATVSSIQSIYQVVDTLTMTPTVYVGIYNTTSKIATWQVHEGAFWTEDVDLRSKTISLTLTDAFKHLKESNCVVPTSKFVVLRCPLGPVNCDAQYIFGNEKTGLVFVNAKTGKITTTNPAFYPDTLAKQLTPESLISEPDSIK